MQIATAPSASTESVRVAIPATPIPANAAESQPIRVRLVGDASGFAALASAWDRLHADAAVASVFNSWLWQYAWWDLYNAGRSLRILVAEQDNATIGILPLYVQTSPILGLNVRTLRLLGCGGDTNPDDVGPLLARGHESAAARALAAEMLGMPDFDVAELSDIHGDSVFPAEALQEARRREIRCELGRAEKIEYIALPSSWEAFLASLSSARRGQVRQKRNRIAKAAPVRFFVWKDAATLPRAAERLAQLHRKRWAERSASFSSEEYNGLHLAAMKESLQRDQLRLYCLELAGEICAMLYCYRFRNRVFLVQAGFDPEHAKLSPGAVLLHHALEHAIGEGNEVFDFLRGQHSYKEQIATASRETVRVVATRPTMGAAVYRAHKVYLKRARTKLRALGERLQGKS